MGGRRDVLVPLTDLATLTREVRDEVSRAWDDITETSQFIGGEVVECFEREWASYCGRRQCIGVANGTDAIELTLRALGIGAGDEVVVPANSFVATAEAVVMAGATPRFVDVDPKSLLVTAEDIAAALTSRTSAVIVVDLYGGIPDMRSIRGLADQHGLALIEDAAQAQGSTLGRKKAGSFGVAGCFSFYPGKNLGAYGDAGAVVTDDAQLAARIRSLANHGRVAGSPSRHALIGRNSRLDALQAAVLVAKLRRLDQWNDARRNAVRAYRSMLAPDVRTLRVDAQSCYHQNVVLVPERNLVREQLADRGIESGIHYPVPIHLQDAFQEYWKAPLHVVESAARQILSLPLFPAMTSDQIGYVCANLNRLVSEMAA